MLPQTAEKPLQYYQDQRGLGNQHGFSHSHSLHPQRANDCSSEHKVYPIKSELEDNVFLPRRWLALSGGAQALQLPRSQQELQSSVFLHTPAAKAAPLMVQQSHL